jgi:cytoskeletal protein CcmA (bactofilin family)
MPDESLQSFLDAGTSFEGKITFTGTIRIDGNFKGEANADGTLIIGETASVEASIAVGSLIVHGKVKGDCTASELIQIGPKARIEGSIKAGRLQIAEGAQLGAKVEMGKAAPPTPTPKPAADPKP